MSGGGRGGAVRLRPIQRTGAGGGCCPRKVNSSGVQRRLGTVESNTSEL